MKPSFDAIVDDEFFIETLLSIAVCFFFLRSCTLLRARTHTSFCRSCTQTHTHTSPPSRLHHPKNSMNC